ncbi:hypothetical protein, partial [Citrobacter youngae]|uniref:hypothetical protein n=1 Tax=Citrobacter youngae TaxID=133448 RepID=UPI0019543FE6
LRVSSIALAMGSGKFLVKNQVGINDEKLFHLCLKRFLDAGELDKAWLMMRHYQERRTIMLE